MSELCPTCRRPFPPKVYKGKDHMAYTLSSRLQIDLDVVAAARHPDFKPPL